jgi:hypothetical protein
MVSLLASYINHNLAGIDFPSNDLGGWNFANQNLTNAGFANSSLLNANFAGADLTNVNFQDADFRGATGLAPDFIASLDNVIRPDGTVSNFINNNQNVFHIVLQNSTIGIKIFGNLNVSPAQLDIMSNKIIFQYNPGPTGNFADKSAQIAHLAAMIRSNGITSSVAAQDSQDYGVGLFDNAILNLQSFGNQPVDPNSLLITVALLGDANLDNSVDAGDFDLWFKNIGSNTFATSNGDFDLSGVTDAADFDIWFRHVGLSGLAVVGQSSSVPEPASLLFCLLALPTRARRRPRKSPNALGVSIVSKHIERCESRCPARRHEGHTA